MVLNIGPSHPAMHGCFRLLVELDGETIVRAYPEVGYLHRCFEKSAEKGTYTQVIPYTDRLNYCSGLMNNVGYCKAVEELMGIEIPERAKFIRVLCCEISRIMDHLVCVGASAVDMGALTNFWYFFNVREKFSNIVEKLCGARLTTTYTRIGGLSYDLYPGFEEEVAEGLDSLDAGTRDVMGLLQKNRIFIDRTKGVGAISKEDAVEYGFTGPCLRACGVSYDVRKAHPYYHYDEFDFEVPLGENGDTYDRLMVRVEEMRQSKRIIKQVLARLPEGPVITDDRRAALPPKAGVYSNIEDLMNHFMLIINGIQPPAGEGYSSTEAANGELGFYIVSDGTGRPYRVKVRPPCFAIYQAYPKMIEGGLIADAIAVIGSLNIIAGELDR
ncbi:MAG: NADH-quinone oxidoreductase subunit D [Deltaproteobacteria bacterium]|nr:NADH-quinone oxidoreductase subunit D [Deltaproteobacteria bacterium]